MQHQLQPRADKVEVATGAQCVQQLGEGRLIEDHRVLLASTRDVNAEVHPVALSAHQLPEIPPLEGASALQ